MQQFLLKNLYWKNKGELAWRMNLPVLIAKMNEILIELPSDICLTPTLFLRGEKSNYIFSQTEIGRAQESQMPELTTTPLCDINPA